MGFDYAQSYSQIETEFRKSNSFEQSMLAVCSLLEKSLPHQDWKKIRALNLSKDLQSARMWLPAVLSASPCPFTPRALYIGLSEFMDELDVDDAESDSIVLFYAKMNIVQFSEFDPTDEQREWLYSDNRHDIDDSHADLESLKEAGIVFTGPGGIGYDGYLVYSVAFAILLLRHLLDSNAFSLFKSDVAMGIATGFGSGDTFYLGELTVGGLNPSTRSLC